MFADRFSFSATFTKNRRVNIVFRGRLPLYSMVISFRRSSFWKDSVNGFLAPSFCTLILLSYEFCVMVHLTNEEKRSVVVTASKCCCGLLRGCGFFNRVFRFFRPKHRREKKKRPSVSLKYLDVG